MDAATLQDRIYSGYGKAALRIGTSYEIFRSSTAIDPLSSGNSQGPILVGVDQNYKYVSPAKYGDETWQILADGRSLMTFDYLVGTATYFICSMQDLLPILVNQCNRMLTISRPFEENGGGYTGYSGYLPSTSTVLMQNCPATVLENSKGDPNSAKLPTSSKTPYFRIYIPFFGVDLKIGDIVQNELGERFVITSNEKTDMGWRLIAGTLGT